MTRAIRLSKKEIAALAGISTRTIRRNGDQWRWLENCRSKGTRRSSFNREKVEAGLKARGII